MLSGERRISVTNGGGSAPRENTPPSAGVARSPAIDPGGADALVDSLLRALAEIGGFEVTYVTVVDWEQRVQHVSFTYSAGDYEVPSGTAIGCPVDLTERVFLGATRSNDLPTGQPDSLIARSLGVATYASVPIITPDHRLYGTLCGLSRERLDVTDATLSAMESFGRMIVDEMTRARATRETGRVAAAETALQERALFLAVAEHKLKSPLQVVAGWAETLESLGRDVPEKDRVAGLASIRKNARILGERINRLLEESMAEVRARDLRPVPLDLVATLTVTAEALRGPDPLRVMSQPGPPVWAFADPGELFQVLAHLVDNAAKYSPPDTTIRLVARESGSWAEIDVVDEGVGIPDDVDVFAPFRRGPEAAVNGTPGVGLGLHIVRNTVTAMGGEVTATRNAEGGSTFTVRLPSPRAATRSGNARSDGSGAAWPRSGSL